MQQIFLLYITTPTHEEAVSIATPLLEERLIACANIIGPATSMYWWEERIQQSTETVLIVKTTHALIDAVIAKVKALHPYDCPCVVALPVASGNAEFMEWIAQETASGAGRRSSA